MPESDADMMQEDEDDMRPAAAPAAAARAQSSQQRTAAPAVLSAAQKVQVSVRHLWLHATPKDLRTYLGACSSDFLLADNVVLVQLGSVAGS